MDDVFSMNSRIDVNITPRQAKKIGLINRVIKLTPSIGAEIRSKAVSMAASFGVNVDDLLIESK